MSKKLLVSATILLLGFAAMGSSHALSRSQEVVLGPYGENESSAQAKALPGLSVLSGRATEYNVLNPTSMDLTFSVPATNTQVEIPANAERRVIIEPAASASLTQGQQLPYYILDAAGTKLGAGMLTKESVAYQASSASQYRSAMTETTTRRVSQTVSQPQVETRQEQPAPRHQEKRAVVRGFW